MSTVRHVSEVLRAAGIRLHKSRPLGTDALSLDLRDGHGSLVTGLWHRDGDNTISLARRAARSSPPGDVEVLDKSDIVLFRRGADFRLLNLGELARRPGALLVAHRAGRRGVVRTSAGSFTKVVAKGKAPGLTKTFDVPADPSMLRVPRVITTDAQRGAVTMEPLPGRTFHQVLADQDVGDEQVAEHAHAVGAAVAHFHTLRPARDVVPHDSEAELAVTRQWLELASHHGTLHRDRWAPALAGVAALLEGEPETVGRLHRDLHDKQLMIARGHPVGLLDLDLAAVGEASLDLANLLVHLELRSLQGRCSQERARRCSAALLQGYRPSDQTWRRLPAYLASSRLRLAAVYAFRQTSPAVIEQLITSGKEFPHD